MGKSFRGVRKYNKVNIAYNNKQLTISSINNDTNETFEYKPKLRKLIRLAVYGDDKKVREHLFVESSNSIVWAKLNLGRGLGR